MAQLESDSDSSSATANLQSNGSSRQRRATRRNSAAQNAIAEANEPADERLMALRAIRNKIIGNINSKRFFVSLGLVERLKTILLESPSLEQQLEAVVIIGSIAHGVDAELRTLVEQDIPRTLLELLRRPGSDAKLTEAVCRGLRTLFRHLLAPRDLPFEYLDQLLHIVSATSESNATKEYAMVLLANCCDSRMKQELLVERGLLNLLVGMLGRTNTRLQEAALDLLSAISRDNRETSAQIATAQASSQLTAAGLLVQMLKRGQQRPETLLLVAILLTHLNRAEMLSEWPLFAQETLMPLLVNLIDAAGPTRARAPMVLALLIGDIEELQLACVKKTKAIPKLAMMLKNQPPGIETQCRESALLAFAAICSLNEDCRKSVIDIGVLPTIVELLGHPSVAVRSAACQCTRSLSRSVKNLRTNLVDVGIAKPLLRLLNDESEVVQVTACATLCNIVLDFSPMKKVVLEEGGLERLVEMVQSMEASMRLNALWALKNLLYQADSEIKQSVMDRLSYESLVKLLEDRETGVQEQALNLVRNVACGKEQDIDLVINGFGIANLINMVESKLDQSTREVPPEEIVVQSLYIVVNIATGSSSHKKFLMHSTVLLGRVYELLASASAEIRKAAVWCVINLTWPDDLGSRIRVDELKRMGFEGRLREMLSEQDSDVLDRVRTALSNFAPIPAIEDQ